MDPGAENWMSRTRLDFNSGDLAFQEIITSRPNRNSATRVASQNAVWPVTATFPSMRLHRSSVLRRSAHALNPKLPQMVIQMLIHQRRPFHRSQRPEKEVRMLRAYPRPTRCKAVNEFAQPLPLRHEVPLIAHH